MKPNLELFIEIEKNGKIIVPRRPAESFVKNFYNYYCFLMCGVTPSAGNDLDLRTTSGSSYTTWAKTSGEEFGWRGNEALQADVGILVGSGNTAENFGMGSSPNAMSYRLASVIANGTAAGQLERASTAVPSVSGYIVTWTRYFNNKSGADVTVREIGAFMKLGSSYFMLTRDVLSSALVIEDTGQLKVEYTLEIDVPS